MFFDLLSAHPNVAWLSRAAARRPRDLRWNRYALRALDAPLPRSWARRLVAPAEAYPLWNRIFPGFSDPCRDLVAADVSPRTRRRAYEILSRTLTAGRDRLLAKITGWPRLGFLREIFPDARFVLIHRDGRAVANSLLAVHFWEGWRGPDRWRWGPLPADLREKWERFDRSFVALAAIQWELLMRAIESAKRTVPDDHRLEVRYEALCEDPIPVVRRVLEFARLGSDVPPAVRRAAEDVRGRSSNWKWREELDEAQQRVLQECLRDSLARYGYDPAS